MAQFAQHSTGAFQQSILPLSVVHEMHKLLRPVHKGKAPAHNQQSARTKEWDLKGKKTAKCSMFTSIKIGHSFWLVCITTALEELTKQCRALHYSIFARQSVAKTDRNQKRLVGKEKDSEGEGGKKVGREPCSEHREESGGSRCWCWVRIRRDEA